MRFYRKEKNNKCLPKVSSSCSSIRFTCEFKLFFEPATHIDPLTVRSRIREHNYVCVDHPLSEQLNKRTSVMIRMDHILQLKYPTFKKITAI